MPTLSPLSSDVNGKDAHLVTESGQTTKPLIRDVTKFPNPQGADPSNTTWAVPDLSGSQSLIEIFEHHALKSTSHLWVVWEDLTVLGEGDKQRGITYGEWWRALQKAARLLIQRFDLPPNRTSEDRRTIALYATSDISYHVLVHAIIYLGHTAFPISTRNSVAAIVHLMKKTGCTGLLVYGGEPIWEAVKAVRLEFDAEAEPLQVVEAPTFLDLFTGFGPAVGEHGDEEDQSPVPPPRKVGMDELALIMHSSGSTSSFPKPILITHALCIQGMCPTWYSEGDFCGTTLAALGVPPFHASGVGLHMWHPFGTGGIVAVFKPYGPPTVPSPDTILQGLKGTKSQVAMVFPSFLEAWAQDDDAITHLASMKGLVYTGAPLPPTVGQKLVSRGVKLMSLYGATEMGAISTFEIPKHYSGLFDWHKFSAMATVRLEPQEPLGGEKDTYELVVVATDKMIPAVFNVPGKREYASRDLIVLHPEDKTLFKVIGRVDDQIMLSTGEKTNPGPIERIIAASPLVRHALMFGRARTLNGILIQPTAGNEIDVADRSQVSTFVSAIWDKIEEGNTFAPQHSRILREMVIIASPAKPFPLTPKTSVIRKAALALYESEIEACYAALESSTVVGDDVMLVINCDERASLSFVRKAVHKVIERKEALPDDVDMFQYGLDSLKATYLRNSILTALRSVHADLAAQVPSNLVYKNPTIRSLSAVLHSILSSAPAVSSTTSADSPASHVKSMEAAIRHYTKDLPTHTPNDAYPEPKPDEEVIVLTGSTGGLGSHLLAQLIHTKTVVRVYALNRKSTTPLWERQAAILGERLGSDAQAWEVMHSPKLQLVEATLEAEDLGINKDLYDQIRTSATMIIHNAWRLDFNLSLRSFAPQMDSVAALARLALRSPHFIPPRILFTSSVGAVSNWTSPNPVPEEPLPDLRIALGNGYGESKAVSDKILEHVSATTPVKTTSYRIGQLAGSSGSGAWATSDWVPLIVRGGQEVGGLPDGEATLDWLAVDVAAAAIIESRHTSSQTLHIVNPHSTSWSSVMRFLRNSLKLPLVPFTEWVNKLERSLEDDPTALRSNPALALLDFFKRMSVGFGTVEYKENVGGFLRISTEKTESESESLRDAPSVTQEDVVQWVRYWRQKGLLRAS